MANSANAVIAAAINVKNARKVVVMSMFGTGASYPNLNFAMRMLLQYSGLVQTAHDQNALDGIVRASGLVFVMPRPVMLREGVAAEVKVFGEQGEGAGFWPSISVQSVAEFLVDAVVSDEWDGKTPVIAN